MPDELGKQVKNDCMLLQNHSVEELFRLRQGRGDLTSLYKLAHHPAYFILKQYARRGAPVGLKTAPWTNGRKDAAIARGPHKSAYDFQDFLRTELLDMVRKHTWMVLPYRVVRHLKNLRVSPIGVVPQHERRPRPIVDYSFSKVNGETITLAPDDAMQFGRALERIITQIVKADQRFGPVKFIKIDIADGFYRIWVRAEDIPKLGVAIPHLDGEEPLVAFPLALPMGWTQSPPYFCAMTETVADLANERIAQHHVPPPHRLEALADSPTPDIAPSPTPPQLCPNPSLATFRAPVASVDVFVDDFIALAQGSPNRTRWVRRILMEAIDDVLRPVDAQDGPYRREPISVDKLQKGDACWETRKKILGMIIDTVSMTLELPPRRQQRLSALLDSIHPRQKRLSLNAWHRLLGELRSMSIALPGARGLFSAMQAAIRTHASGRLRLDRGFHDAIEDFRWLSDSMRDRPTRLQELVPTQPTLLGAHDASGRGAGGVWFPSPEAVCRDVTTHTLRQGALIRQSIDPRAPVLWRVPFDSTIQDRLISFANPTGTINNSELELAGSVLHNSVAAHCYDIRERTIKSSTDNIVSLYWDRKGSITASSPAAYLLRAQALHQRHHRYLSLKDYLEGPRNGMADDASRLLDLSPHQLLTHFDSRYPQSHPWQLWTPPLPMISAVTSAVHRRRYKPEWFLPAPTPLPRTGPSGNNSAADSLWILPSKGLKIPSPSSKHLRMLTATDTSIQVTDRSGLAPWKMQYVPLAKRLPQWGPRTHA